LSQVLQLPVPEPGQLVDVRRRRYVVVDIAQSPLPPDILTSGNLLRQHLVTISSVEDDALGEELQVIWEIEPGATAIDKMPLPQPVGFDTPQRLDTFLNAVRWGAASSADVKAIQAPFRSGVDLEDYQLDPVARAIQMPRVNLLIADDVGLGKTIEAGLVQPRGKSAGGKGMIEYRAKHREGDCPHALSTSKTASCQPLATRASTADGSAHYECPTTRQARSHHSGSSQRNEQHQDRGTPAGRL